MFDTLFVRPIFNVLTFIYGVIPGHDFGVTLILFTILVRLVLWPLVKKQLQHTKKLRALQPELKKIKQQTKGDKQKEAAMTMALYKEREINPLAPIGLLIIQLPILFALYGGLMKLVRDPQTVIDFSYSFVRDLPWMKEIAADISKFDISLFGVIDLTRRAIGDGFYLPAFIIVVLSSLTQYFASKQLMVTDKDAKSLSQLLKEASRTGKQADQSEVSAAVSRLMRFIIPGMIFFISISLAAALSLYWFVSGLIAYIQQAIVLNDDKVEMEAVVNEKTVTAEVVDKPKTKKKPSKKSSARKKKRR